MVRSPVHRLARLATPARRFDAAAELGKTQLELCLAWHADIRYDFLGPEADLDHGWRRPQYRAIAPVDKCDRWLPGAVREVELQPKITGFGPQPVDRRIGIGRERVEADEGVGVPD